jgi:hypothetical protein
MVDIFKLNTIELEALVQYKEVLEKNQFFPKGFWTKEKEQTKGIKPKCRILTRYCFENLSDLEISEFPKYNLKQLKEILIEYKLFGMVQRVFNHDVLAILKNAYPEEFRTRQLKEWMWSKHGIWNNKSAIIEAINYVVKKEGIKRIEDIPTLNWKSRLLKHGTYNVLSYFNWSIYSLFDFVYPNKFHPTDFKYKIKWSNYDSLENSFYFMHKIFKKKKLKLEDILLLNTSDFRRFGLTSMLNTVFDSSTLKAKEYYLYKTLGDKENQKELREDIRAQKKKKYDENIKNKLNKVAVGGYIYNLYNEPVLYNYIKRHAKKNNMSIGNFIKSYGFIYKSSRMDFKKIDKDEIWNLRKQGFTYVQIAQKLNSNPTTITKMCVKHFGGDPLIPRPIEDYITVQELMNKYRVDHKTVMKIVNENGFQNHTTIRFRYLKKSEIEPALKDYKNTSKHHQFMIRRYVK